MLKKREEQEEGGGVLIQTKKTVRPGSGDVLPEDSIVALLPRTGQSSPSDLCNLWASRLCLLSPGCM